MSGPQRESLRHLCRSDLYFLANGILGYTDMRERTHGPMCRYVERDPAQVRLMTVARGVFKSTIFTVADSIRLALNKPNDLRLAIFSEVEDNAHGWLAEIKTHFTTNELLRALFPEVLPERTEGPGSWWQTAEACLRREPGYNFKEATFTAMGYTSAATSQHYNHIKTDDLIGERAKASEVVMEEARRFIRSIRQLTVEPERDHLDFAGTHKGVKDAYVYLQEYFKGRISRYHRRAIENGESIFPERMSVEFLNALRETDPVTYFSEYDNDPIEEGTRDFDYSRVRAFDFDARGRVVFRDTEGRLKRYTRDQLDVVMCADPNSGSLKATDNAAIGVYAFGPTETFVFDTWGKRVPPDAFVDQIYDMWRYWRPRVLGIEEAGQQTTAFYFAKKARELGESITQVPLRHRNRVKEIRIRKAVQPIINKGNLFMRLGRDHGLRKQLEFFPQVANDDEVDTLAYATEVARIPDAVTSNEEDTDDVANRVLALRNPRTGYSR